MWRLEELDKFDAAEFLPQIWRILRIESGITWMGDLANSL